MTVPTMPARGDAAPAFALPDASGSVRRLRDFAGRPLAMFFYPRADTPSCTAEAQDFTARKAEFERANCAVVGVSADPPRKLARFADKRAIGVALLSDEAGDTLRAYGVWGEKSMYGKTFEGIVRSTFLIGANGRIVESWRVTRVAGHADDVLAAARKIT